MIGVEYMSLRWRLIRGASAFFFCLVAASGQDAAPSAPPSAGLESETGEDAFAPDVIMLEQSVLAEAQAAAALRAPEPSVTINAGETGYSSAPRRFHYSFELQVREVYDDNIDLDHLETRSDFYTSIEPKVILGLGDTENREENYVQLDYSPTLRLFAEHGENNAFEQAIRLEGQYHFRRLQVQLSQDIQIIDNTEIGYRTNLGEANNQLNLDVSGRVRLDAFTTAVAASYDLSSKTFLSGGLTTSIANYRSGGLLDSQTTAGNIFINYRYSPKLVVGLGAGGGFEAVDPPTPDQTFEQMNVRIVYEVRQKLLFNASAGVEVRQFEGESREQYVSPVLQLGALYRPFPGTELKLNGRRRTQSSATLAGQDYSTTSFDLAGRQRLFRRLALGLAVGYENAGYFNALSQVEVTRNDNYYYVSPSADVLVTRYAAIGIYYLRRQNETSDNLFSFKDNQIGLRCTVVF